MNLKSHSLHSRDRDRAEFGRRGRALVEAGWPAVAIFGLLVYLAFAGGGFDPIVYGRVGVGSWWIVLVGALIGVFGLDRTTRSARIALLLIAAFVVWTGASMIWSESAGRSAQELARGATYLGTFVLALLVAQRGSGLRLALGAVGAAVGVVAGASLLLRFQPDWFPKPEILDLLFAATARLNFPLNSWNGLAALIAIGAPLLVHFAVHGRHSISRGLATAALPVLGLAVYLTLSRGGALALALGLLVLLILHPRRRALLPTLGIAAAGAAVLIWAAEARPELVAGVRAGEGLTQGDAMTWITPVVCLLAALAGWATRRAAHRWSLPAGPRLPSVARAPVAAAALVAIVAACLLADVPDRIGDGWEEFKDAGAVSRDSARLETASGNGRYQWWTASVDAFETEPALGIGSGTFEFWWTREGSLPASVLDAHSLYLETLGELGVVGLLLVVAMVGGILALLIRRALRAPAARRARLAAACGAGFAFAAAAATDWVWELPVLPICFLVVAAAGLTARLPARSAPPRLRSRLALAALAVAGLAAIGPQLLAADSIRGSQERVEAGELEAALNNAELAARVQPYSGAAALQEALVLELMGRLNAAGNAAREATREEPTNWENWLVLSRIEAESNRPGRSIAAIERAAELHPSSTLLQGALDDGE